MVLDLPTPEGWKAELTTAMHRLGVELAISQSQVRCPNHYTTEPDINVSMGNTWKSRGSRGIWRGLVTAHCVDHLPWVGSISRNVGLLNKTQIVADADYDKLFVATRSSWDSGRCYTSSSNSVSTRRCVRRRNVLLRLHVDREPRSTHCSANLKTRTLTW